VYVRIPASARVGLHATPQSGSGIAPRGKDRTLPTIPSTACFAQKSSPLASFSSAHLPGLGAALAVRTTDMHCAEVLRRDPAGTGEHLWVLIRRTDLATTQVRKAIARAVVVDPELVSCAGSRDRRGTCEQWFSVPVKAVETPGALKNVGYQNKVRSVRVTADPKPVEAVGVDTLRWRVRLRGVGGGNAYQAAKPILDHLRRVGCPNFVPRDLFGRNGEWARWGRLLARGERLPARVASEVQPGRCLWAYQHACFNRWLAQRIDDGLLATVVAGDRLLGGKGQEEVLSDVITEVEHAQRRLDSWEANVLGPLPGDQLSPVAAVAAEREQALFTALGLDATALARLRGARRPMRFQPTRCMLDIQGQDLDLQVDLPTTAHVQVIIDELGKPEDPSDVLESEGLEREGLEDPA